MKITVLTLFPEMFGAVTGESILGRATRNGVLDVELVNIRDYTLDKHGRTDDSPFGGGAGMVFTPEPCFRALKAIGIESGSVTRRSLPDGEQNTETSEMTPSEATSSRGVVPENDVPKKRRILYPSPRGRMLDKNLIEDLSLAEELVILCGHYEGIDQRILDAFDMEEVSTGDYILTGGELPAMTIIDAVSRFLPGVLGNEESNEEESVYSGLLEYPHYTKPRVYAGLEVPEVLFSGDHEKIRLWRFRESLRLTKERRPDLFRAYVRRYEEALKQKKLPLSYEGLSRKELRILKEESR